VRGSCAKSANIFNINQPKKSTRRKNKMLKSSNDPSLEFNDLLVVPANEVRGLFWPRDAVAEVCITQDELDALNAYRASRLQEPD
jgi:hypothetical protein